MAAVKKPKQDRGTGKFIPCAGNFLRRPSHGMPVFMEIQRTAHAGGKLYARCGVCGHSGFWFPDAVMGAYSREEARDSVQKGVGILPPVDGSGRPL